ncbi:MAG: GntR family transcriptional regulator [Oscillospiraceae bacterium]|nr:GntR family transcriptional regulator [Oscillospiraceae bacterium]
MRILIDNLSGTPIYEQIFTQIKNQILSGELAQDMPLPSIRNLAKDLRISVITTKRAYDELEKGGYIYTVSAKGSFVAPKNTALLQEESLRQIEEHMRKIRHLAPLAAIGEKELKEMWTLIQEEQA